MERPPLRAVKEALTISGPNGGTILVLRFECGHQVWQRVRRAPERPATQRRCTGCWVDAALERSDPFEK